MSGDMMGRRGVVRASSRYNLEASCPFLVFFAVQATFGKESQRFLEDLSVHLRS